jgi:hypothetical protein
MSQTSKFLLCSGSRGWAPCIRLDRKGAVYCMRRPLSAGPGPSNPLLLR